MVNRAFAAIVSAQMLQPTRLRTSWFFLSNLLSACSAANAPDPLAKSVPVVSQQSATASASSAPGLSSARAVPPPARPTYPRYTNGRFEPVVTYAELEPKDPERECTHDYLSGFSAIAAYSDGAWLVGSCGVRVRVEGTKVERFPTPVETRMVQPDDYECAAYLMHWSIAARSRSEAWLLSSPRCNANPNAVWPNVLERFDGKAWRKAYSNFATASGKRTGGDAFEVFVAPDGAVFTQVHDMGGGSDLRNSLGRFANGRFTLLREGLDARVIAIFEASRRNPEGPVLEVPESYDSESYVELLPLSSAELFSLATRQTNLRDGDIRTKSMVLALSKGAWSKEELDDASLSAGARAPSGVLWAAGKHLWRRRPGGSFEPVLRDVASSRAVSDIVVRGEDDLFLVMGCGEEPTCVGAQVLHYDGTSVQEVEVVPAAGLTASSMSASRPHLAASANGDVWLQGENVMWRLGVSATASAGRMSDAAVNLARY